MSKSTKIFTKQKKPLYFYSSVLVILLSVFIFTDIDKYVPKGLSPSPIVAAENITTAPMDSKADIDEIEISATGDWNVYNWSFDEVVEARVLKPYTFYDLKQFGIEFQVNEKERYSHFNIGSDGIIAQRIIPFNEFKNTSIKKILSDKTVEIFTAQVNESRRLVAEGHITDANVMQEFGDSYHVPVKIINGAKNSFKKMPGKFITIYEIPLHKEVKAIIGKVAAAFTGKNYHFDEETHTVESTVLFMPKDRGIVMHEFARCSGYAFFRNKKGQEFFLLKQTGYEGIGIDSYLINSDGLKLMASVGAGV